MDLLGSLLQRLFQFKAERAQLGVLDLKVLDLSRFRRAGARADGMCHGRGPVLGNQFQVVERRLRFLHKGGM